MTRCHTCSRPVGLADQHVFDAEHVYCAGCCPQCAAARANLSALKRGHRRGTPRSWAYIGRGS